MPANFNRLRLAYDLKHNVFAIGGGGKVTLYNATYDAETGAPTLVKWTETAELTLNMDGIAFDYAGDLYVVSAGTETFYKFALPTDNNTCTTPAPKAQVVAKSGTTAVDNVVAPATVQKLVRNGQVLIIRDAKTFNMLGQEVK